MAIYGLGCLGDLLGLEETDVQVAAAGPELGEVRQTDLRYVKVAGRTYYVLVMLDVWSRFVVYHELLRWMDGETVSLAALSALETVPEDVRSGIITEAHS